MNNKIEQKNTNTDVKLNTDSFIIFTLIIRNNIKLWLAKFKVTNLHFIKAHTSSLKWKILFLIL